MFQTRVFATNSLTFLPDVDLVVVMKDGCISECGTYERLRRKDGEFARLLREYVENDDEQQHDKALQIQRPKTGQFTSIHSLFNTLASEAKRIS